MKTVCAWHKKYFPKEKPEPLIKDDGKDDNMISHGMCKKCEKKFREENNLK